MRNAERPKCHICYGTSSSWFAGLKRHHAPVRPCAQCGKIICEQEVVRYPGGNGKFKIIGCKSCAVIPQRHQRRKQSKATKRVKKSPHRWLLP